MSRRIVIYKIRSLRSGLAATSLTKDFTRGSVDMTSDLAMMLERLVNCGYQIWSEIPPRVPSRSIPLFALSWRDPPIPELYRLC
jgi:hypothetical protein